MYPSVLCCDATLRVVGKLRAAEWHDGCVHGFTRTRRGGEVEKKEDNRKWRGVEGYGAGQS